MFKYFEPNKIFAITSKAPKYVLFLFVIVLTIGLTEALILSPEDYKQSDAVRIMYVHVPAAWISLGIFTSLALLSVGSFVFKQAVPSMKQGFKPNTISTDIHTGSMNGGMKNLLNVMSKFLNLDMSLEEVIAAATWSPATYLQNPELGHLSVGAQADLAILNILKGNHGFVATYNIRIHVTQKFICDMTL